MTAAVNAPGYRNAHEEVDARLVHTKGILCALGQMINLHPALRGNDPQSGSIKALVRAGGDQVDAAISVQDGAWESLRGQRLKIPKAA